MPDKRGVRDDAKIVTRFLYVLGVTALVAGFSYVFYLTRHTPVFVKATSRQAEPFTELYFSAADHLPTIVHSGQKLPVQFTIHNLEAHSVSYTYVVDFTPAAGQTSVLDQQQLNLSNGHTATITDTAVTLPAYTGRAELSVVLPHQAEGIHYWVQVEP